MYKRILIITLAAIGLSFLASSCVKEKGFEDRVKDIVSVKLDSLNKQVAVLEKTQTALNDSLKNVKGNVESLAKQSKDLTDSIATVKTALAAQKEWTEAELKTISDKVADLETEQKSFKTEVYERLGKLESRIQKIDVIPEYNDGSVGIGKGDFELSFIIRPDSVAQQVAYSIELFKLLATRTLTKSSVQVDTIALKGVSYEKGVVTITIDGSKFPAEMLDSTKSHSGCLVISDGNSETTSGFFPMTQVRYPEFRDSVCTFVKSSWWAPVNCGYDKDNYKYGKLYQWGRKDGCGYNNSSTYTETIIQTAVYGPVSASSEEASKFYKNDSSPYDWLTPQNDKRWNSGTESSPTKTDYDPCPIGWRVPTGTELYSLTGSTSVGPSGWDSASGGYWFNGTSSPKVNDGLFLPAAGRRNGNAGDAEERGSYGYYWSSSVEGNNARLLYFYSGIANVGNSIRASGFSVRCVQE